MFPCCQEALECPVVRPCHNVLQSIYFHCGKKNTTDTISCGKIRRDIIHDFNLPDDEIVRQANVAVSSFLFAHGKYEVYRHNRGRFTT